MAQRALDLFRREGEVGGSNGLVGLLGILAGGVADRLGGQVAIAELVLDLLADGGRRLVRNPEAVGTHVGDQADRPGAVDVDSFVELLGDLHGSLARKPQPDRGLLLERAGLERGVGLVELFGLVDLGDRVGDRLQGVAHRVRLGLGLGLELGAVVLGQARLELVGGGGRAGRAHGRGDLPVFLGDEGPDVALAVGDQPHGDRLHAAGAQVSRTHLLP